MEESSLQPKKTDNDSQREKELAARKLGDLLRRTRRLHQNKNQQGPEISKEKDKPK
jgi:phage host-nuclease inhibitor protein Gam